MIRLVTHSTVYVVIGGLAGAICGALFAFAKAEVEQYAKG